MQSLQLNGHVVVKRESSALGDLELGLSCNGGLRSVVKEEEGQFVFTAAQIQELYSQVTIFGYIFSGLPVPIYLVFPIWNSVASSFNSAKTGIYRYFPSLATVFGFGDCDYRGMMDPEPGRCRRTDGKKWRCYKDVIPHQKYCEKHMHRGSQRSRKHVEANSKDASKSNTSYGYASSLNSSSIAASTDSRVTIAVSTSLDLTVPCSNLSESLPETLKDGSSSYIDRSSWKSKGKSIVVGDKNCSTNGSLVRVLADKNNTKYKSNYTPSGKGGNSFNHIITSNMDAGNLGNNTVSDASFAPGFGLSPKSVLQHDKATVCTRLNLDCKAPEETEPQRCRRSDGRKWRCRRDVVADKKYCEIHLCRGSKRATVGARMVMGTPVSIPNGSNSREVEDRINLNTDLSISMAATPQKVTDGDTGSFSSSDATTVTDENASISQSLTLSP